MIRLKSEEGDQIWEAHITTQAGADTWTEPWLILGEMLQNAIDEEGQFGVVDEEPLPETVGTSCKSPSRRNWSKPGPKRTGGCSPGIPHVVRPRPPRIVPLVDGVLQHLAQDEPGLGPGIGARLGGDVGLPDLIALLALQPDHLMVHLPDSRGEEFAAEVIVHAAGLEAASQPVQPGPA